MDYKLLLYHMNMQNVSVTQICEDLHMSRSAFYRKTHGISEFTIGEINRIVDYLGLDSPMSVFFPEKCRKRHRKSTTK